MLCIIFAKNGKSVWFCAVVRFDIEKKNGNYGDP
jgi:hypothetical protein